MDAVKNPSSAHLHVYVGLGLILAVIAGLVFQAMNRKEEPLKVTIDDLPAEVKQQVKKDKKRKPVKQAPTPAPAPAPTPAPAAPAEVVT